MFGSTTPVEKIHYIRQDSSQSSPTLLPQVISTGLDNDGQSSNGQDNVFATPSLTSTNNFINFCGNFTLTTGEPSQQLFCNPAPMGHIPAPANMPSTRFQEPQNGGVFLENSPISVTLLSKNLAIGNAVNPGKSYLAAPQQLNSAGLVLGHCHIVVDALESFGQQSPTDPSKPVFFTEVGTPMIPSLSTTVTLPVGFYRMTATIHAANHQPVVVPLTQHGSLNDVVYFIVQPNPKSKRSIHQTASWKWARHFTSQEKNQRNSSSLWKGMTRRQDPSTSLTLDPSVIASAFSQDGTDGANGTFTPSLTSTNNFINYCATLPGVPLTNGTKPIGESCNPVPIGLLPSVQNIPSVKFTSPAFNDTIKQNTPFVVSLNVTNFVSSKSTNSAVNFLSAPQQLIQTDQTDVERIMGHSSFVIEEVSTAVTNPSIFSLTATIDTRGTSNSGVFTMNVTAGLPVGVYRLSSIVSTANFQPVVMSFPDHGAIDDAIFFSVTENGGGPPPLPTLSTAASTTPTSTGSTSPLNTTSAAAQVQTPHKTQSMAGEAAGIAIGAVFILGIVLVVLFLWKRRKTRKQLAEFTADDNQINLTPFEDWRETGPSMIQNSSPNYSPPPHRSDLKSTSTQPPEQDNSRDNLLAPTSSSAGPSNTRKSTRQNGNVAGSSRSENRRSNVSRVSLAPSYHTTAG